jgi:nucleoside-diphosphate-sugar epimerase
MVANTVQAHGYPAVPVTSVPWPEGVHPIDRRSFVGDIAPMREWCGWQPRISLEEGLRNTVLAFAKAS